jgi:hypothetical protein
MFARARIAWPPLLKNLFQVLSVFNLNMLVLLLRWQCAGD